MNVLKAHLRITIATLLASGTSQREIEKRTGVDRKTIRRYARVANSPGAIHVGGMRGGADCAGTVAAQVAAATTERKRAREGVMGNNVQMPYRMR